jgi:UDP-2-acetamido-2-deoxy-ribo-hexuluronate aminotransferase
MISVCDLGPMHSRIRDEIKNAIEDVIDNHRFVNDPLIAQFEEEFAASCGQKYAVACNSGTDSLRIALDIAIEKVKVKDQKVQVLTTPFSFFATSEVIKSHPSCYITFSDVNEFLLLDPNSVHELLRPDIIITVDLYGQKCDYNYIRFKYPNALIIQDACQAHGFSSYEGDLVCFSFFPSKNLGCFGDGGAIVTNNSEFVSKARYFRNHGQTKRYVHDYIGYNSRLDTMQAAILLVKLKYLKEYIKERQVIANEYIRQFSKIKGISLINEKGVFNQFTVWINERDKVAKYLYEVGIETAVHYPIIIPDQKAMNLSGFGFLEGSIFCKAKEATKHVLSLPIFPYMHGEQIKHVVKSLIDAVAIPENVS